MKEDLRGNLLVVDDDSTLLDTMKDILESEGFSVDTAKSGQEGLEKVKDDGLDLVLTDMKMPGLNGIQFLHAIKKINSDIPVIVLTGFASLETAVEAMREGAHDYIIKPFEVEKLLSVIQRVIKERKLTRKNKELLEDLDYANKELNKHLHHLFRLDELSKTICSNFDMDNMLSSLVSTITDAVNAKVVSLMVLEDHSQQMVIKAAKGLDDNAVKSIKLKIGEGIPGLVAKRGKTISSPEAQREKIYIGETEEKIYRSNKFVSLPILSRDRVWGVLNISDPAEDFVFSGVDLKLLEILASQVSIAVENSQLNGKLQNSYLNTLQVLASAIEAKSKYTRGHSERVTQYAAEFARLIKLSDAEINKLKFACGVHDIGKINIDEAVLNKSTKLSVQEWQQMRQHPDKGVEILIPLGMLKEIVPLVKHHHERYDGKGYPDGLKGEEIPMQARIISLVDAYDAMTSTRPYRVNMDKKTALKEIENNLGKQFDARLGNLFIESMRTLPM